MDQNAKWNHRSHCIGRIATIGMEGAGTFVVVGEDVDRTLSKNQHILNIVPTSPQHPPHPHVLSTRIPRT